MPDVNFSAKASSKSNTKTVVKTRKFEMIIDEPENMGGTNEGANPVEYMLGALAGCLNVVGHLVAKEMGFSIDDLNIELEGTLDPAKFSGKSEEGRAGYKKINVDLGVETNADKEMLKKWAQIVEKRCPVSDNLANETPINISVNFST